jgi:hypothetical protein
MLGAPLIRYQVVQMCEPRDKHLLAPTGVMEPFHREQFPVDGVMSLIQQGAHHWHLPVFEDRIPVCCLGPNPLPDALAVRRSRRGGDVVRKAPPPLAQRKHAQASPLSRSVPQGVELRAQGPTDRRRDRRQFLRKLDERVAQAVAETRPWK